MLAWVRNLLVLAVLVGGGAWLYVRYQLERAMDELAAQVAPVGILTRESVFWNLRGDVGARGLALSPSIGNGVPTWRADEVVLHTPGTLYVLGFRGDDAIPMSLGVTLEGIRSEAGDGDLTPLSYSGLPFEALACGDVEQFRASDLRGMRLSDMTSSITGRYFLNPPERVDMSLIQETGGVSEVSLSLGFIVPNLAAANRGAAIPDLRLATLKISLDASEFNDRRNRYCARRAGVSVSEFLDAHVGQVVAALRERKLLAGPSVLEQYRQFASGKGPWTFISRPDRPLPLAALAVGDPLTLIGRLNLTSALNAAVASPVVVTRIVPDPVAPATERTETQPASPVITAAPGLTAETGVVRQTRWVDIDPASATGYVDRAVRLTTRFGREYSGRLVAVADGQLQLESHFPGGAATVPIPIEHVSVMKVAEKQR